MSFKGLLNKTCTIQSETSSQTSSGELSFSWVDKATDVPCRVNSDRTASVNESIGKRSVVGQRFYFDATVDINAGDRIIFEEKIYEVLSVTSDSSVHHLEVQTSLTHHA